MTTRPTVLLIDDDPDIRRSVARLLAASGFHVETHERGFNSTNVIASLLPALVLLDVNMPFLSGDQLATLLKENRELSRIPVVFFSSNDEATLRELVSKHRVAGYIPKSAMALDLVERVTRFIKSPPDPGGGPRFR